MKNAVFWDVAVLILCEPQSAATCSRWFLAGGFFYPEDGGETSVHTRSTQRHIPEDAFFKLSMTSYTIRSTNVTCL
jgi:hypothetical protein